MPAPTRSVYVHGPNTLYAQTQRDYDYNRHKHELEELLGLRTAEQQAAVRQYETRAASVGTLRLEARKRENELAAVREERVEARVAEEEEEEEEGVGERESERAREPASKRARESTDTPRQ